MALLILQVKELVLNEREGGRKKLGRFPFKKNFGLNFRKSHVPSGTVNSRCTDTTQATARLIIVLIRGVQKSVTGTIIFQMEGEFRPDR